MLGIFLDTETNGLNPFRHVPIEIAFKILNLFNLQEIDQFQANIQPTQKQWEESDPESLNINKFTLEELHSAQPSSIIGAEVRNIFTKNKIDRSNSVFICQNPSFDRAFFHQLISSELQEKLLLPYHWLDLASMHWISCLYQGKKPWDSGLSKDKIALAYQLPPEKKPHRAMNGVDHLILCYQSIIKTCS